MSDALEKHSAIEYLNKPFFVQLKRVTRAVRKLPNQDNPVKAGVILQAIRKAEGNAATNEKIARDVIGNKMEMSPREFRKQLLSYEVPTGKKLYIKPETAYQQTQRLVTGKSEEEGETKKKTSVIKKTFTPLNKTISVSVFGHIYDEILEKYKKAPNVDAAVIDEVVRSINRNLSSHFDNAAAFVRWTHISPRWIHIDAFQTDFFNRLKDLLYHEKEKNAEKANALISQIIEDFRKHETDFFKTAVSYIVRSNPQIKIWTAATEQMVQKIEHVHGDVKLKELYYQLPKKLGFKLIPLTQLYKILGTRPGKEMENAQKVFHTAIQKLGKGRDEEEPEYETSSLAALRTNLLAYRKTQKEKGRSIVPEQVDSIIQTDIRDETLRGAIHQFLPEIVAELQKPKVALEKLFSSKAEFIKDFINKAKGQTGGKSIWFANRTMLFESTRFENRLIIEQYRGMAGL
jgi:hypothetical protein